MQFPDTWEEFEQAYGFEDKKEIYTNGSRLIQSFRVKQWLDHTAEPERKNGEWKTVPWKIIEHGEVVVCGDAQLCSVCRHAEKGWKKEMKYCPNCGSEMSRGE